MVNRIKAVTGVLVAWAIAGSPDAIARVIPARVGRIAPTSASARAAVAERLAMPKLFSRHKTEYHNQNPAVTATEYAQKQEDSNMNDHQSVAARFVESLAREDFAGATEYFDSAMKAAVPANKLQEAWQSLVTRLGPFQSYLGIRAEKLGQYDIAFVTCEFEKGAMDVKLVFNSNRQITGLFFVPNEEATYKPPAYAQPDTFQEQAVQVGSGDTSLPGTLTLPVGDGPFPAVVLVHGSGPNDRDETLGPNKPFRDLAWGLASRGIAVLRYDKRTKVHPEEFIDRFTVKEEVTDDALAAVSLLRQTEKIDAEKIYVLGHSLGGMLVPRIGTLDPKIAGLIVMAGPSRPFEDIFIPQLRYIASLDGAIDAEEEAQIEAIAQQVARIKDPDLNSAPDTEILLGAPPSYWLDLRGYHPPAIAQKLSQPILILQAERDYQVTLEDFQGWQHALSDRPNVTFKSYSDLNHLFIAGQGKSTPEEYQIAGNVAEGVVNDIANWIKNR